MYFKIDVENFRIFKEKQSFFLSSLSLLIGPNNSGKSTFIKLLLLLKNGLNKLDFNNGDHDLESFEKSLSWGREGKNKPIKITLPYYNKLTGKLCNLELNYENGLLRVIRIFDNDIVFLDVECDENEDCSVRFNLSFFINLILSKRVHVIYSDGYNGFLRKSILSFQKGYKKSELKNYRLEYLQSAAELYDFGRSIKLPGFKEMNPSFNPENPPENPFDFRNKSFLNEVDLLNGKENLFDLYINNENKTDLYFDQIRKTQDMIISLLENNIGFPLEDYQNNYGFIKNIPNLIKDFAFELKSRVQKELIIDLGEKIELRETKLFKLLFEYKYFNVGIEEFQDYNTFFQEFFEPLMELEQQFKDIHYLSARRGSQKRVLLNNGLNDIDEIVSEYYKHSIDEKLNFNSDDYLQKILRLFEIKGDLVVENFKNFAYEVSVASNGKKTNIADMGFGFSQLLPIALKVKNIFHKYELEDEYGGSALAFGYNDIVLIIEEPEANLHPKFQSKLADFFAITIAHYPDIRFVVETHSEYFVRKLQFLTAKGEIDSDKVVIHYFNENKFVTEKEPKIKQIVIRKNGNLSDSFGPGFYDEITNLQFELLKINHQQNN